MSVDRIIIVNRSFQALDTCDWMRAATLIVSEGAESYGDVVRVVRTPSTVVEVRQIVALAEGRGFVPDPDLGRERKVTFRAVKERDGYRCAYCESGRGSTVDHIIPKSRGGQNTWDNLIACCPRCNNVKDDRTPMEAGMKLRFMPVPIDQKTYRQALQEELDVFLAALV